MVPLRDALNTAGMGTSGIAVGCTTCAVQLFLDAVDDAQVRDRLTKFFDAHGRCDVFVDVSRTVVPLPRGPRV